MQGLLFQTPTGSELTKVRSAFRLGKWKQDQGKPRAVLVELLSVAARHTAFQATKRLRAVKKEEEEEIFYMKVRLKKKKKYFTCFGQTTRPITCSRA